MTNKANVAKYNQDKIVYSDIINPALSIDEKLDLAQQVSSKFTEVIKALKLVERISGKEYVTVSGWSVLGNFMGTRIENIRTTPIEVKGGFGYHAKVDLVNKDGVKIAEGDAIATSRGRQKEDHTVYSMAITRATGKAYRLGLAWLVEMAGYTSTPAEEMPDEMRKNINEETVADDAIPVNKINKTETTETVEDEEFNPADYITSCENNCTKYERTINQENMLICVEHLKKHDKITPEQYEQLTGIIKEEY